MPKAGKAWGAENQLRSRSRWTVLLLVIIALALALILLLLPPVGKGKTPERAALPEKEMTPGRSAPSAPPEAAREQAPIPPSSGRREHPAREARIALVIDDVGYNLASLKSFLSFPGPISFSVLPQLPHSEEAARLVIGSGKELLLHMPMEPLNGEDPGPGAITSSQSDREIEDLLERTFARFPEAVGMNNHMGSRATADERVMAAVMRYLSSHGRFFLDSRTSPASVAGQLAERYAVPFLSRDVFMDNETDSAYIEQALERGVEIAVRQGRAVLIGHVQNEGIAELLSRALPELKARGVRLISLSALLAESGDGP